MKNLKKQSAVVLCAMFAAMQISSANIDTGLGIGNGGASIIDGGAGYVNMTGAGTGNVGLNFNANSHVKWDTLNVNKGEALNFNAVNGANDLTILNTVNNNMSKIYGDINANSGIGKLIISNPNGVLFDGARFTAAGDTMITTKDMTSVNVNNITDGNWGTFVDTNTGDLVQVQILKDSNMNIGGEFKIVAPKIVGDSSTIKAGNGLKLVTANGSDYTLQSMQLADNKGVTFLKAMNIDGNIEIVNNVGALSISDGGNYNGDLNAEVGGLAYINTDSNNPRLTVNGDANIKGHGEQVVFRNADVKGKLDMTSDGGSLEINNMKIDGDTNLTTTGWQPVDHKKYNHYVHVIGDTEVGGDLNIESSQNIHIGGYEVTQSNPTWAGNLREGNLVVKGDLNAHTTGGHIMTTVNTTAKNVKYNAEKYNDGTRDYGGNILSDGKAVITADTYDFKSAGYIGGLKDTNGYKVDNQIVDIMENYTFIPSDIDSHEYMVVNGGTIKNIETPKVSKNGNDVQVYIKSNNDLVLNGANAGDINLVAPDKKITITGDVHAKEINIGDRTNVLKLDFPSRDFTTNYTSIRDEKVVTINPDEEITYELADGGYNKPTLVPAEKTTYLIGPDPIVKPDPIKPDPITPDPVNPDPVNPTPDTQPAEPLKPTNDDNVRVKNWVPEDPMQPLVNTPVAFAADLDDDELLGPCRKNVDGSVTVVRAYPMAN